VRTGTVKELQLTVGGTQWEVAPGKTVAAHAFNRCPRLRVTERDTKRVTVNNDLSEPTNLD